VAMDDASNRNKISETVSHVMPVTRNHHHPLKALVSLKPCAAKVHHPFRRRSMAIASPTAHGSDAPRGLVGGRHPVEVIHRQGTRVA
jgi:hypothetical protein